MSDTLPVDISTSRLFEPTTFGKIELANRVVMAPLTRMRAGERGTPGDLLVEYYRQRASVGMITTEGTYPSFDSQSYVGQPGIASDEQAAGWARVAEAVHAEGGKIVMQLMHGGRTSHPQLNGGRRVLAPSAIAVNGELHVGAEKLPYAVPEAMTAEEIKASVADHVAAARRAIDAGLDGVEIHSANGYLLHQFLAPGSNERTDEYGGTPEDRARYVIEVVTAVAEAVGADRVGLRISPAHNIQDAHEPDHDDVLATYGHLLGQLRPLGLAYLSVLYAEPAGDLMKELQQHFGGKLVVNGGFMAPAITAESAAKLLEAPFVDAVAVGRAVIANPDLVARWRGGHPENEARPELFYAFTAEGYTDYPFLTQS
ncbi:2,4-dienoyl-CoA reductase-like NADH-dependent reductase (Old Yellow Enzyme family) [Streptomyces sp. Ag109_O5-1]|uniref:alkene reductase n=1 Tax=Streptomyces sp. Ag109_O5-1 TaxID=1938851 RepID=UPI000F4FAAF7|nr:alkene reductase [Streptomyces sp. Ag109_O5-1]RPE38644.1 2,4-dienoyl-CoA reductase-like NADH-dependent reductase (Old Yellow Enzyme family) [Streptomyces sp. Ag109_O5-1]